MAVDRSSWPMWVRLGLWGLASRTSAWVCLWLSLALAIGCVAYGIADPRFFVGGALVVAALGYYLAIRWVDQNSRWS